MENTLFNQDQGFEVELDVFQGPFSVLLSMIYKKKLDVTEVAIAAVTDDFIAFVASQDKYDLSQVSEFLLVAATLLELKTQRLLPRDENEDEYLELLEERDLLFAKLLQYKTFKQIAHEISLKIDAFSRLYSREVQIENKYVSQLPEVKIPLSITDFAHLAEDVFSRSEEKEIVKINHLHSIQVSVESQIAQLRHKLSFDKKIDFRTLCVDARNLPTVVARFMAILELLRSNEIEVTQKAPLESLYIKKNNVSIYSH